jgi:hypothetical protein
MLMTSKDEGLLTDVAVAIGSTLGHVVSTTNQLVGTAKQAKQNIQGRPARRARKVARKLKARAKVTVRATKKATRRASHAAKRSSKVANQRARSAAKKARRALP